MSDGSLRTCLGRDAEIPLREALAEGKDALKQAISQQYCKNRSVTASPGSPGWAQHEQDRRING
jgi:molybdenum cofactor biosynthesis enzyme MoaA